MKRTLPRMLLQLNFLVLIAALCMAYFINCTGVFTNQSLPAYPGKTIVIDAGHGMPDGGATSCTGVLESDINLQISQRLRDFMHFMGLQTVMTRTTQESIYSKGNTIAQKKVSDTRNRVDIINSIQDGILISIHQNHFYESQYSGPQVFYKNDSISAELGTSVQSALIMGLKPLSARKAKLSSGVYIMEHIRCPGILIECGFLSNPQEEALLRSDAYQKKLCTVVAIATQSYVNHAS